MKEMKTPFFEEVCNLLSTARKNVKKATDLAMVYSYFEVGRRIVEEEQTGADSLKQMRQFYLVYAQDQFGQTVSDQFKHQPTVSTGRSFF